MLWSLAVYRKFPFGLTSMVIGELTDWPPGTRKGELSKISVSTLVGEVTLTEKILICASKLSETYRYSTPLVVPAAVKRALAAGNGDPGATESAPVVELIKRT